MYNREMECMEQYPYTVTQMNRIRGGIWCQCEEGNFFLKEYEGSAQRILFIRQVMLELEAAGFLVDTPVLTKEGEPVGEDSYGKTYTLRSWYTDREISATNEKEVVLGARLLGKLLRVFSEMPKEDTQEKSLATYGEMVRRKNRELKTISNFIGKKRQKNEFDMEFRRLFWRFYEQGLQIAEKEAAWETSVGVRYEYSHRDYTHHNVLVGQECAAVVHFDNLGRDSCVADFALYARKLLEKNQYREELFCALFRAFEEEYPLTGVERRQLYLRLAYPSRFLKIVNHYATTRKNHIILRDLEKLGRLAKQEEERSRFLAFLEEFVV
ncbi:Ser/Thr protein kinase RdoA involved in Cpx stress response, MazF antagonist [Lachnospiraceae bacterium XBB1006]|nr:Ser/Thr protein kinase RdoA involved in Cpx stress response, MazF antagonist [Lachnospiraceae bacterium XBB1006]